MRCQGLRLVKDISAGGKRHVIVEENARVQVHVIRRHAEAGIGLTARGGIAIAAPGVERALVRV